MGIDIFHGYGFGMAKPSGFVPAAISTVYSWDVSGEAPNMITSMTLREVYKCALERYSHRACLMSTNQNTLDISTGYVVMLCIAN
jgi:hypothetical protein